MNIDCQQDLRTLREKLLIIFLWNFLDCINLYGKIYPTQAENHPIGWVPDWMKVEDKRAPIFISLPADWEYNGISCLRPAVLSSLPWIVSSHSEENSYFLKVLFNLFFREMRKLAHKTSSSLKMLLPLCRQMTVLSLLSLIWDAFTALSCNPIMICEDSPC